MVKMNLKINTSLRGRGKWGDFLVALVPLSWCANILLNSNFILRMIEWQNESSIFTVRIHGKQWYWVYKFDLTDTIGILTAPKNIGRDKWVVNTPSDIIIAESYLQIIQLRSQQDWVQNYWKDAFNDVFVSNENSRILDLKKKKNINLINKLKFKKLINNQSNFDNNNIIFKFKKFKKPNVNLFSEYNYLNNLNNIKFYTDLLTYFNFFKLKEEDFLMYDFYNLFFFDNKNKNFLLNDYLNNFYYNYDKLDDLWDVQRSATRKTFKVFPFRIIKNLIKYDFFDNKNDLINFKFFSENNILSTKTFLNENYWVLKQKRYKKKLKFFEVPNLLNSKNEFQFFFENNKIIKNAIKEDYTNIYNLYKLEYDKNPEVLYKIVRNNRQRSEMLPIHLCRRLLRTKKTLVLPTHLNISLITNSYDVVHSWYIPSLGIKLDCVPGRSTHHTLYLDYVGLYYGQCAEICGRYHHHMPIRIAGLPFEHFAIWWQIKGHPKFLKNKIKKENFQNIINIQQKYTW